VLELPDNLPDAPKLRRTSRPVSALNYAATSSSANWRSAAAAMTGMFLAAIVMENPPVATSAIGASMNKVRMFMTVRLLAALLVVSPRKVWRRQQTPPIQRRSVVRSAPMTCRAVNRSRPVSIQL
jgi:hypothetical protein